MWTRPQLGATNLALISLYFAPVWAADALRTLLSPFGGFDDRAHAKAASLVQQTFDFGLDGLVRTSHVLAGTKLVIAVAFLAYLIEFSRAIVTGREPNRETLNVVLLLAFAGVLIWAMPAFALDDGGLIRRSATQLLLVMGAVIVIVIDRHVADTAPAAASHPATFSPASASLRFAPVTPTGDYRLAPVRNSKTASA